jgi:hypothetical protein|tara:strand:- start:321 stop:2129 length:1809 start_codon:yes stop_codon:yes gene_type:complete
MSFLLVGAAAVGVGAGVAKAIGGAKRRKAAEAEAKQAKAEVEARKQQFAELDTSNPFANMENKMEDLTVNQQEAEFMKQQQQQSQANILNQLKGAAGSSGVAGLAQTLANQGALDAQKASISIGRQEQANQQLERQAAQQIQAQERQGEIMSRDMERSKISNLMAMASADEEAANMKEQMANQQMWSGIGQAAGSITNALMPSPATMKSPMKQVDAGLISAYRAGKLSGVDRTAGMGMDVLGNVANQAIAGIKQKRAQDKADAEALKKENAELKAEGQELAQTVLDASGGLGENIFDAFSGNIKAYQEEFDQAVLDGDKDAQAKIKGNMNNFAAEAANLKDLRMDIAKTFDTKSFEGKEMPNLIKNLDADSQGLLKTVMDPNAKVGTKMVDGKVVTTFNYNGKDYTRAEIEQKLYDSREDVVSINEMQKLRDGIKAKALEDVAISTDETDFTKDFENIKADTKSKITKTLRNGNLLSLVNDDILGNGRSFKEDLFNSPQLNKISYESLGLKAPKGDDGQLSPEEVAVLSDEDKSRLVEAMTNRDSEYFKAIGGEDMLVDMMADYVTADIQTQYNNAIGRGEAAIGKQYATTDQLLDAYKPEA